MRKADVVQYFGSVSKAAKAIGKTRQAVSQWPEVIPEGSAYKIQAVTKGKLRVDPDLYPSKSSAVA
jgi:hypothetical protein